MIFEEQMTILKMKCAMCGRVLICDNGREPWEPAYYGSARKTLCEKAKAAHWYTDGTIENQDRWICPRCNQIIFGEALNKGVSTVG